ncbi:hypothetical protein B0H03_101449 [Rathayibacter iranicus NCPPB 2253 = VKM Ac-1602]|uniref:Uncharacterized protein n=1 Tax=Rathayibacter iranicus NCPPB 2253 = VKM Ac-1602 TaxID=1328868 RepID=A0ABX5LGS8_9MICO|nr:hypothetical protein B0H03_101449 [Rathayibacter iranicus NCPPB 2253 = VKM Ac-1602]
MVAERRDPMRERLWNESAFTGNVRDGSRVINHFTHGFHAELQRILPTGAGHPDNPFGQRSNSTNSAVVQKEWGTSPDLRGWPRHPRVPLGLRAGDCLVGRFRLPFDTPELYRMIPETMWTPTAHGDVRAAVDVAGLIGMMHRTPHDPAPLQQGRLGRSPRSDRSVPRSRESTNSRQEPSSPRATRKTTAWKSTNAPTRDPTVVPSGQNQTQTSTPSRPRPPTNYRG